ncbi:MAG TPA: AAA family ATPase [Sedimentisphaerales bacterium]|nr:AAA family ATPase [Sedimentisphaerales bacterium]
MALNVCQHPGCERLTQYRYCQQHSRVPSTAGLFAVPVTLVCGPSGAGKSRYVDEHKRPGDLVIEVDALFVACGAGADHAHKPALLPFVCEARDAMIARLMRMSAVPQAWVITTSPGKRREFYERGARIIVIAATAEQCRMRMAGRPRQERTWEDIIARWFRDYEAAPYDEVITNELQEGVA